MRLKNKYFNIYIILVIFLFITGISFLIPKGVYLFDDSNQILIDSYHLIDQSNISLKEFLLVPLMGLKSSFSLLLLILSIGVFISVCNNLNVIDNFINKYVLSKTDIKKLTVLISLFFIIGATTHGMYETTIGFAMIISLVYKRYNVDNIFVLKLILFPLSVGHIGSTINPFLTGVAATNANISMFDGFLIRLLILVIFSFITIVYLLNDLKKYDVIEADVSNVEVIIDNKANYLLFITPFILMVIMLLPIGMSFNLTDVSLVFIFFSVLILGINRAFSLAPIITGIYQMRIVILSIFLARCIYVFMQSANINDTIIHFATSNLQGYNELFMIIILCVLVVIFSILIPSTSALAMILIPILAPTTLMLGFSDDFIVTLFQMMCGSIKMISITSPLVVGLITIYEIDYKQWFFASYKFSIMCLSCSVIILYFIY